LRRGIARDSPGQSPCAGSASVQVRRVVAQSARACPCGL